MTGPAATAEDRQDQPPGSVLYVCGMNAIRSPMAEFLTRHLFGNTIYAKSAGARAGDRDAFAEAAMAEIGISIADHQPTTLDDLSDSYFDLVITLSPEAHHRALELTRAQSVNVEYWPIMDPSVVAGSRDQIMAAYRQVRDTLENRIRERLGGDPDEAG